MSHLLCVLTVLRATYRPRNIKHVSVKLCINLVISNIGNGKPPIITPVVAVNKKANDIGTGYSVTREVLFNGTRSFIE